MLDNKASLGPGENNYVGDHFPVLSMASRFVFRTFSNLASIGACCCYFHKDVLKEAQENESITAQLHICGCSYSGGIFICAVADIFINIVMYLFLSENV